MLGFVSLQNISIGWGSFSKGSWAALLSSVAIHFPLQLIWHFHWSSQGRSPLHKTVKTSLGKNMIPKCHRSRGTGEIALLHLGQDPAPLASLGLNLIFHTKSLTASSLHFPLQDLLVPICPSPLSLHGGIKRSDSNEESDAYECEFWLCTASVQPAEMGWSLHSPLQCMQMSVAAERGQSFCPAFMSTALRKGSLTLCYLDVWEAQRRQVRETPEEYPGVSGPPWEGASNTGLSWKPDFVNAYKLLACH